jgi:thioredoxin reductase (NADPH)
MEKKEEYPLIIIGAGPAGLTASIYASRYALPHLIIGEAPGGLMFEAHQICNFPTEKEISGAEITAKIQAQAESLGANILTDKVTEISYSQGFHLSTQQGKKLLAENILLATGTEHRQLGLAEEKKFLGRGLSYCATCDAPFYKGQRVAVIGGGDSANTASLYLANIAEKVYQIHRRPQLTGERAWVNQVISNPKIEIIYEREVISLEGEKDLQAIILNQPHKGEKRIPLEGIFIEIGSVPRQELIQQLKIETNPQGYIKVKTDQSTSQEHVWAAGDITDGSNNLRQIVTACSEGAIAAYSIFQDRQKSQV